MPSGLCQLSLVRSVTHFMVSKVYSPVHMTYLQSFKFTFGHSIASVIHFMVTSIFLFISALSRVGARKGIVGYPGRDLTGRVPNGTVDTVIPSIDFNHFILPRRPPVGTV